jgi:anaerobic magnesium-protoporphyrin IX monomethyl ester cyclase
MKVALIGAEIEENLALRHLHASLCEAGHQPRLFGFSSPADLEPVARAVAAWRPAVAGLSMLFTSRSREFVALARRLRELGFEGHLTAGGHFAAFHAAELLRDQPAFDSIATGEGEELMVELCERLQAPETVPGLVLRDPQGGLRSAGPRPNRCDLDGRPWPTRPERFHRYLGLPVANMLAGRGCWGSCAFCSIQAAHRLSGGRRFRQRAPAEVAAEMAGLYHRRGVRIFNFQDDNFLLPIAQASLERLRALKAAMDAEGIGRVALQIKARPDSITPEVADQLVSMGLFRVFLGVETDAVQGLKRLGRGVRREQNHRALAILREREVHTAFNLLMFDPDCDLASLRDNVAFMGRQRFFPLNFCRVEVYAGTPLEARLKEQGRLQGDYHGQTYTIADPAAQRAYELFWRVFAPRNFGEGGMAHEAMRLDYLLHLLRHFHPARVEPGLWRQAKALVADLNRDSALRMGLLLDRAAAIGSRTELEAAVVELREGRAHADRGFARETARLIARIERRAGTGRAPGQPLRAARPCVAAALLASAWVGADRAMAQDGDPPAQRDDTIDVPAPPDTHMCEAAPPPWDLYQPPPPPPPLDETVLQLPAVQQLRMKYLQRCSANARLFVDEHGKITRIVAHSAPRIEGFERELEQALKGLVAAQEYRDQYHWVMLWQQVVSQVQEVIPEAEEVIPEVEEATEE